MRTSWLSFTLGAVSGFAFALSCFSHPSPPAADFPPACEQALYRREETERKMLYQTGDSLTRSLLKQSFTQKARIDNDRVQMPEVVPTCAVVSVVVSKTLDTGSWVITIRDPNGKVSSFWVSGGLLDVPLPVSAITNY